MPDWMDHLQDQQALASDELQRACRMPDVPPPSARDCDECGEPIPHQRLAALPTTQHCVTCATALEHTALAYGGAR